MKMILCSASPARLTTLRSAGLRPEVVVSGVDESGVRADTTAELTAALAALKTDAVHDRLEPDGSTRILVGCDSLLDLDGTAYGKPNDEETARRRWRSMRSRSGTLLTGHQVIICSPADHPHGCRRHGAVGRTTVHFAALSDDEIDAYLRTGEPLQVAGAFTLDGLGGPFVTGIEGDPHNVVGISLPLLRTLLAEGGIDWPSLWE